MAASVLAEGGRPDTFATDGEVAAFFRSSANQNRGVAAAFLLIPAALLFLWLLTGAFRRLPPANSTTNPPAASLAFSHTYRIDPQEARLTAGLAYWMQGASMAGASLL